MTGCDREIILDYYDFRIRLRNKGNLTVRDFRVEVEIPRAYAKSGSIAEVTRYGRDDVRFFRRTQKELRDFVLYPEETSDYVLTLDYMITEAQYRAGISESIVVTLYSGDKCHGRTEYAIKDFLNKDRLQQLFGKTNI
jgi:hypothetical protein